jgi:hypothetical protein
MAADLHHASAVLKALEGLSDVRRGLKQKPRYDDPVWLQIEAYEGDDDGGTGHGTSLVPNNLAPKILDAVEVVLRAELQRLGVQKIP